MIDVTFDMFFDRPAVEKAVKDGTQSTLSKMGSFVRQRAKTSIRKRKGSAKPGNPPSSHAGQLRDMIYFGYDASSQSVVIGPQFFKSGNPTIPELLEYGGVGRTLSGKLATYEPFPFMQPALEAEQQKFADLFSGAIVG